MPFCSSDICILALLDTTREQYHQLVPVLAKINSITRTRVNPVFINAGANTFHIREVSLLHPMDCRYHLDRSSHVQANKPFRLRTVSLSIKVFSNLYHNRIVAYMLPLEIPVQRWISGNSSVKGFGHPCLFRSASTDWLTATPDTRIFSVFSKKKSGEKVRKSPDTHLFSYLSNSIQACVRRQILCVGAIDNTLELLDYCPT